MEAQRGLRAQVPRPARGLTRTPAVGDSAPGRPRVPRERTRSSLCAATHPPPQPLHRAPEVVLGVGVRVRWVPGSTPAPTEGGSQGRPHPLASQHAALPPRPPTHQSRRSTSANPRTSLKAAPGALGLAREFFVFPAGPGPELHG